jgi:hypothetical protein
MVEISDIFTQEPTKEMARLVEHYMPKDYTEKFQSRFVSGLLGMGKLNLPSAVYTSYQDLYEGKPVELILFELKSTRSGLIRSEEFYRGIDELIADIGKVSCPYGVAARPLAGHEKNVPGIIMLDRHWYSPVDIFISAKNGSILGKGINSMSQRRFFGYNIVLFEFDGEVPPYTIGVLKGMMRHLSMEPQKDTGSNDGADDVQFADDD